MPWTIALLSLQVLATAPAPPATVAREAWLMGTRARVFAEGPDRATAEAWSEAALREIERFDRLLSTWDPDSPLGRLNRAPVGAFVPVGAELGALLAEARTWALATDRAFEPGIGALVDAWDLRGEGRIPNGTELQTALAAVGPSAGEVSVDELRRHMHAAWIDSGGFGKGAALRSVGVRLGVGHDARALVDLGGQVLALASAQEPWTVEVAHPRRRQQAAATLAVWGVSVATSGTSERGGHILDPRSGHPVLPWGSVTVVHADALVADILSTALYVMGPEEGLPWARSGGAAALFIDATGSDLEYRGTPAMKPWLLAAHSCDPNQNTLQP